MDCIQIDLDTAIMYASLIAFVAGVLVGLTMKSHDRGS